MRQSNRFDDRIRAALPRNADAAENDAKPLVIR